MIESKPRFLNGVYSFQGGGYDKIAPLSDKLVYAVPSRAADLFPGRQFQQ